MKHSSHIKPKSINEAIERMGRHPINPIGHCFDSVAAHVLAHPLPIPANSKVIHGIAWVNLGQDVPVQTAHAWIEWPSGQGWNVAFDTTWGLKMKAVKYRKDLNVERALEYSLDTFVSMYKIHKSAGPWDPQIKLFAAKPTATGFMP